MKILPSTFSLKTHLLLAAAFTLLISVGLGGCFRTGHAAALSGSSFQAGNIIENGVFFSTHTMSATDIQNFLNSKVPTCDTNGSQMYNGSETRAQYGASVGNPAPYTCLKDYSQTTPTMSGDSLCSALGSSTSTSAQIIYNVSMACGINPEVLIVLLQKEQSLVTDTWPFPIEYTNATGFGCPDTAPCDPSFGGFFYQVYYAAHQFKNYAAHPNNYGYFANSNNNILYNPSTSCGSSTVYIQNQATANLYIYTPYQPNQAALDNLYGSGDSCSAYGNRNFWRYFSDWFGSTHAQPFAWQPLSQQAYTDSARTLPINTAALSPNTTYYFTLQVENMGDSTWHNSGGAANNQVNLATSNPSNRNSIFANNSWLAANRPATLTEATVDPGGTGTFKFSITTPNYYARQTEYFNLVADGVSWLNDVGLYWNINVIPPTPLWQPNAQNIYLDSNYSTPANPAALSPNTNYYIRVSALNTGNTTWTNSGSNPVRLGTASPTDRVSAFCDTSWISCNRPTALDQASVAPGQVGTFSFHIKTPSSYGTSREYFNVVSEGNSWLNDNGLYFSLTVRPPTALWQYQGQAAYTDSSKNTSIDLSQLTNGTRFYVTLSALNTGNTTWTNSGSNPVRLGTASPTDRVSAFCDTSWISCNRPTALDQASVAPGQVGTFSFWMQAPYGVNGTNFNEYFTPVVEGSMWMNNVGQYWPITMQTSTTTWQYLGQSSYSDAAHTHAVDLTNASVNTTYYLELRAKNTSGATWSSSSITPTRLGIPNNQSSPFCNNTWISSGCNRPAVLKEGSVAPGQTGTFDFSITTPSTSVNTQLQARPVIDGQDWLTDVGLYWPIVTH